MPFQPAPNIAQVALKHSYLGQDVFNVLHFAYGSGQINAQESEALAGIMNNAWGSNVMQYLHEQCIFRGCIVTDLTSEDASRFDGTTAVGIPGGTGDAPMPGSVALCLKFTTAKRGRSFAGRMYISGMSKPFVAGNQFVPAWVNDIRQAVSLAIANVVGSTSAAHVVLSRTANGVKRIEGLATPVVSITTTDLFVDNQRRRLQGRGA